MREVSYDGEYLVVRVEPHNKDFVAELKSKVPSGRRERKNATKSWRVQRSFEDIVNALHDHCYPVRSVRRVEDGRPNLTEDEAYGMLWLRTGAPRELVDAAYRCLVDLYEGDVDGGTEIVRGLTFAHRFIKERLRDAAGGYLPEDGDEELA